ncbi:tRNA1(Val) A37 N6-methylase TrmN6 [Granulicatella balaenopterae]|uniref:tRNA1(Val) A37 N6-methylase TrmN6 n=1 Tax=Granulicatella balaenopterae TaxID=137733 RepID=A0A1H9JEF7_9LACT|nr:tRNA1(Val) (adenine(37)-N6)-methyltransferase [Granulicatella balaenopterae]SEQ85119.1 tRNA1(Val) A37 N6-methylase TrmN6 [Granulicatella balaenopterae]
MKIELKEGERIDRLEREGISIIQSSQVFSFSLDAVLLADFASLPRTKKGVVVDLCSGNGAVAFLLTAKTKNKILGVELQSALVDMAKRTVAMNNLEEKVSFLQADVRELKGVIAKDSVDVITCNPPYFKVAKKNLTNKLDSYTLARHEVALPLEELLEAMSGLLKMKGKAYMVHRPDRMADIIILARKYRLEPKRVQFVSPKKGKESNIMLIEFIKDGGLGGMRILPELVVFDEQGDYTSELKQVLFGEADDE